jgi:hypothetical protein
MYVQNNVQIDIFTVRDIYAQSTTNTRHMDESALKTNCTTNTI